MDVRRRAPSKPDQRHQSAADVPSSRGGAAAPVTRIQASDALPLPINHTNILFSLLFAASLVFLMRRWREKVRNSTPLHILGFSEIVAMVCVVSSLIYLISFFGIAYVQSVVSANEDEDDFLSAPVPPPCHRSEKMLPLPVSVSVSTANKGGLGSLERRRCRRGGGGSPEMEEMPAERRRCRRRGGGSPETWWRRSIGSERRSGARRRSERLAG